MVAAANPLAVDAGIEILKQGGSAVDAAIAVQTTLGLVDKTAEVWSYDGRETAPSGATEALFQDEDGKPLRYFNGIASGRSTGVPGAMVMLNKAHQDYGNLPWGRQKQSREYFFLEDGTTTLPVGYLRDNPDYAQTLRALQNNPRALLEGPIAEKIIDVVREEPLPGTLTLEDMAAYQPKKREALCSTYRKHIVCGAQPPSSGAIAVQSILGILENFDIGAMGQSVQGWHHFIEASFLGYADRNQYVADDAFVDVPVKALLDKNYLSTRAALITDKALGEYNAGNPMDIIRGKDATPDSPGTSHFTVIDKTGLTVSMTTNRIPGRECHYCLYR